MKTVWYVKYEIATDFNIKTFDKFEEANIFARKLLKNHSAIPEYINDIRNGNRKSFRGSVADFLEKYYSDPEFIFTPKDIPSDRPEDYSEKIPDGIIFGEELDDDDDSDYEYDSPIDYFDEDEFMSPLSASGICSDGYGDDGTDLPEFKCNISFLPNEYGSYDCNEEGLYIKVYPIKVGGGRSNPLQVLHWIQSSKIFGINGNANKKINSYNPYYVDGWYDDYADEYFDFMCNRTIFRHIELLKSLGYVIDHERFINEEDGEDVFDRKKRNVEHYFTLRGKTVPAKDAIFGKSAYPIIVLRILEDAEKPLLQSEIIERAKKMFNGTTIHRKAIGNSIKELLDFEYKIEHTKEGYFLAK